MKCQGNFRYRGIQRKDGGTFVNGRGQQISYKESYALKLDEDTDAGIMERTFKVPIDSPLIGQLSQKKIYDEVVLDFDVQIFNNAVKIIPVSLIK